MKILHEELLSSYLFFGWIDSKGKLILPTINDKNSPHFVLHADLLDENINSAFRQGYVRFLIEKSNPKRITYHTKNLESVNTITFLSGMKEIENLITTNKINPKVFPNPVPLPENHVLEYEKNNKFYEISAISPQELKRKLEAEKIKLTESKYIGWKKFNYIGWADQNGRVFFDWNNNYEGHSGMINHLGYTTFKDHELNKGNARQKGYTRLVLADDRLMLNAWFEYIQEIGKENWLKLVSNIIKNTEAEIIKNEKLSIPQGIVIDISGFNEKNEDEAKKYEIDAPFDSNFIKKYRAQLNQINEHLPMDKYYLAWGWVDVPNHYKLILPTLNMKQANTVFYHADIVPEKNEIRALENKKVKWSLEKTMGLNKLFITAHPRVSKRELMNAINVVEKFLESEKGTEIFPYKSPIIWYYTIEYRDADDTTISALTKQELFNKLRNLKAAITETKLPHKSFELDMFYSICGLNEYFEMEYWYLAWGWATPQGKLILPTLKMKENPYVNYIHDNILDISKKQALGMGFIRWFIELGYDKLPKLVLHFLPEAVEYSTIVKTIQNIEKFLSKQPDPLFSDKPSAIFKYEADVVDVSIRGESKIEFLRKLKEIYERGGKRRRINN